MFKIGENIRQLREAADMSQDDLAVKCGLKRQTIHKYEHGIITNIPLSTIAEIAEVLNTTPQYILGWEVADPLSALLEAHELQMLKAYRSLPADEQSIVLNLTTSLSSRK